MCFERLALLEEGVVNCGNNVDALGEQLRVEVGVV
jgi:hypothetical protein